MSGLPRSPSNQFISSQTIAIFQAGKGRDPLIQACTRDIWLTCAVWDVTLAMGHVSGISLTSTADALSRWHLGQTYKDRVGVLLKDNDITCINVPDELFHLSNDVQSVPDYPLTLTHPTQATKRLAACAFFPKYHSKLHTQNVYVHKCM